MPESSPSVLLIRLDAIGDALALTPLLAAMKVRGIPVDLVLSERNAEIFAPSAVRHRIVWKPGADAEISRRAYSHALVATESAEGYRIAQLSAAPVRIGFDNGWGKPFKTMWIRSLMTKTIHRTAGLDRRAPHECEVLFRLGAALVGSGKKPAQDAAVLRPLVIENEPQLDARVIFQVTDKWERLGMSLADVVACARRLVGFTEVAPLPGIAGVRFIASSHESAYSDTFERTIGLPVDRFPDVRSWKSAIAAARALVAPDSGAIHVAGMTGVPTVAVFPARHARLQIARWHPWAAPYRIVESGSDWPKHAVAALPEVLRAR